MRLVVLTIIALSTWLGVVPSTPRGGNSMVHTMDDGTPQPRHK